MRTFALNSRKCFHMDLERVEDEMSGTHHLNLSIFTNAMELDLLIGQRVMQGLLGGGLYMSRFI